MNRKLLVFVAIVTAASLTGIFSTTSLAAFASVGDSSETDTAQDLKQKNTGSGDSDNINCDENLIKAGVDEQECNGVDLPPATLSVCKLEGSASLTAEEFLFTVTGNNPSPAQFFVFTNGVEGSISPGEYAVSEVNTGPQGNNFGTRVQGDCVQDPVDPSSRRATGEIQAGETQECTFFNFLD